MICISPLAPMPLSAIGLKRDSTAITASTSSGSRPTSSAARCAAATMRPVTLAATRKRRDTYSIRTCCAGSAALAPAAAVSAASAGGTHTAAESGATAAGGAAAMNSAPVTTTAYIRILLEAGTAMRSPRERSTDGRGLGDAALSPRPEVAVAHRLQTARQNLLRDTGPGDSGFRYGSISCKPLRVETN